MRPEDKARKAAWKAGRRAETEAAKPMSQERLDALADALGEQLGAQGCDDTARLTIAWATREAAPTEALLAWANSRGGYCDCEILANALDDERV